MFLLNSAANFPPNLSADPALQDRDIAEAMARALAAILLNPWQVMFNPLELRQLVAAEIESPTLDANGMVDRSVAMERTLIEVLKKWGWLPDRNNITAEKPDIPYHHGAWTIWQKFAPEGTCHFYAEAEFREFLGMRNEACRLMDSAMRHLISVGDTLAPSFALIVRLFAYEQLSFATLLVYTALHRKEALLLLRRLPGIEDVRIVSAGR